MAFRRIDHVRGEHELERLAEADESRQVMIVVTRSSRETTRSGIRRLCTGTHPATDVSVASGLLARRSSKSGGGSRTATDYDSRVNEFVSIDDVRLEYAWHGPPPDQAPTLVFLHEGLGSIAQWRDFPAALCSRTGCSALVYNRLGHGRSDPLTAPRSVRFMHDEAITVMPRLLDAFQVRRPILVGHSDGASIAVIYAGSGIGRPLALALEAPHVFVEEITVTRIAEVRELYANTGLRTRLARYHGANVDTLFRYWTDIWLRPEFRAWNIEEYLSAIDVPTLVIQGKNDEYGTERQVEAIVSALDGRCEAIVLDHCRHSPHIDQRVKVEDAMSVFVRRI